MIALSALAMVSSNERLHAAIAVAGALNMFGLIFTIAAQGLLVV